MRLLSRLEAKQSRRCAVPALLGRRSWASCPSRSLLHRSSPSAIRYFIFRQSPKPAIGTGPGGLQGQNRAHDETTGTSRSARTPTCRGRTSRGIDKVSGILLIYVFFGCIVARYGTSATNITRWADLSCVEPFKWAVNSVRERRGLRWL